MISVQSSSVSRVMIAAALVLTLPLAALAGATPEQKCEGGMNQEAGKYAACIAKAEKGFVSTADGTKYGLALTKCEEKLVGKWDKLEASAAAKGAVCPSVTAQADVESFLDACGQSVAAALAGGTLGLDPVACAADLGTCDGDLTTCTGDLGTCNGNLGTCTGALATANAGTAAVGDVLAGKTFTSTAGLGATGTMSNNGAVTLTPTTSDQTIAAGYHDGSGKCEGDADLVAGNIKNGVSLFGVTGTVSAGGLQKTGQTLCYDTAGTLITCAFTGLDGELQKGAARSFTDNGNGTVTDNLTGLMWEKQSDDGSIHDKDNTYTWANAFASKVATLNSSVFAGHNDWRVPNIVELESLKNFGAVSPAVYSAFNTSCEETCTVLTCSCTQSDTYWSSSTYQVAPTIAWIVAFNVGLTGGAAKPNSYGLRAVRAGF